ncbi:MAG: hemolysin, partial [Muribaculaceae bacterium]|nr:hemolysin [Muribaculaceae bacterium]
RKLVARQLDENTYEFSGRMEIEKINENYRLDLPESDDYQTIAGLLLERYEAMPNQGDTIEIDNFTFTILKKSAARIELVKLQINNPKDDD